MKPLISLAIVLAAMVGIMGTATGTSEELLPLIVQGRMHPTATPTPTPIPPAEAPILHAEQHFDNDGSPICEFVYTDDLGWVEICSYSFDAVTSEDIVRVAFCNNHPPFGGCLLPNAERIEDGLVYWNRIGFSGPQLYTFRTDTAAGNSVEYDLKDICEGDCNW